MSNIETDKKYINKDEVTITINKKSGQYMMKGKKESIDEILAIIKKAGLDIKINYKSPCG